MQFSILGSLEVRGTDGRVPITAPKQRAVLAALLLNAGDEVTVGELVRHVWDARPPATAQTTLQSYIYRLRRLLRPLPGVRLSTDVASYLLEADRAETDLWAFRDRVRRARAAAGAGCWAEAATGLRAATALWRGNAFTGVPGDTIRQAGRVLDGERIAAYEELFGLETRLGNTRQIVPELQKVVSAYPLHEAFQGQLMLALYASGRQGEALQAFASMRRRLRERLGIEPGVDLQRLHRQILRQVPVTQLTPDGAPRPVVAAGYGAGPAESAA